MGKSYCHYVLVNNTCFVVWATWPFIETRLVASDRNHAHQYMLVYNFKLYR